VMRRIMIGLVAGAVAYGAAPSAWAHAFLDHASPAVGSSVPTSRVASAEPRASSVAW